MIAERQFESPDMVRRQNRLFDLYGEFQRQHADDPDYDPDDDPDYIRQSREIMGLAPVQP